ncbi:DUF3653 domain-containing protein [Xanthomonas fragariae]|uniref:DUF3653 domain-containing protein n=3 Tax=Xanthomonas fragariae TaxID=48664 RepID=UPI000B44D169
MYIMSNRRACTGLLRRLAKAAVSIFLSRTEVPYERKHRRMCEYLSGRFAGWRVAGNYLVSPDGDRMTPERLKGLVWRDQMELRLAGFATRRKAEAAKKRFRQQTVKVVVVNLSSWRDRHFGTIAG